MAIHIYGTRERPPGNWRVLGRGLKFDVAGVQYRKADAERFVRGAAKCDSKELPWGVSVEREPQNSVDANAIKVFGWWTEKGWFGSVRQQAHVGYYPAWLAAEIATDCPTAPIAAEVYKLYIGDGGYIDIELVAIAAAPPKLPIAEARAACIDGLRILAGVALADGEASEVERAIMAEYISARLLSVGIENTKPLLDEMISLATSLAPVKQSFTRAAKKVAPDDVNLRLVFDHAVRLAKIDNSDDPKEGEAVRALVEAAKKVRSIGAS